MVFDGDFETQLRSDYSFKTRNTLDLHYDKEKIFDAYKKFLRAGAQIIRVNTNRNFIRAANSNDINYSSRIRTAVKLAKQAVFEYCETTCQIPKSVSEMLKLKLGSLYTTFVYDSYKKKINKYPGRVYKPLVAGCCYCYKTSKIEETNGHLSGMEELNEGNLMMFYEQRVEVLLQEKVDLLAFEAIPTTKEVNAIIKTLKKFPDAKAWITLFCPFELKLVDGNDFEDVAVYCYDNLPDQIIAVGAACVLPNVVEHTMRKINRQRNFKIPFILYIPVNYLRPTCNIDSFNVMSLYDSMEKWWLNGVRFIGGDVGTTAIDIKDLSENALCVCQSSSCIQCICRNAKDLSKL